MSIYTELKRRNVFRVGIAYAVASWVLLQIVDVSVANSCSSCETVAIGAVGR